MESIFCRRAVWVRCLWCLGVVLPALVGGGCASQGHSTGSGTPTTTVTIGSNGLSNVQVRSEMFSAADNYLTLLNQAFDNLANSTQRREVRDWAEQRRITMATVVISNAASPNETVALIDMAIMATLAREAVEDHWIPTLLHDEGKQLLEQARLGEQEVWASAARVFTPAQIADLHIMIDSWRAAHPDQYYIGRVRLAEFAEEQQIVPGSSKKLSPGSILGFLYLDPLSSLDPVARELQNYRAVTERAMFVLTRMPTVWGWQANYAAEQITSTPEAREFVATMRGIEKTAAQYPADISKEREAAIKQAGAEMTDQRAAMSHELGQQLDRAAKLVADAQKLVADAAKSSLETNDAIHRTMTDTEQASRRTINLAFWDALILLCVIFVGVPIVVWCVLALRRRAGVL